MTPPERPSETGVCGASCGCAAGDSPGATTVDSNRNGANATSRRRFLQVLGTSGAGAAAAAACGPPDFADKMIPHLVQDDTITPGVSDTYATVLHGGPTEVPVHARVRDGRVLTVAPNERFPGGTQGLSSLNHSVLQDLYDPDRLSGPRRANRQNGQSGWDGASWDEATQAFTAAVAGAAGSAVLLTGRVTGVTARFLAAWARAAGAEHIAWEPFGHEAIGGSGYPGFDLSGADEIVCFGADFLGTWLDPEGMAASFAEARTVEGGSFAKFTFVGPRLSLTGTNADEWLEARAGTEALIAAAVANEVAAARGMPAPAHAAGVTVDRAAEVSGVDADRIRRLAEELAGSSSAVAVPPGIESQGPDAQAAQRAVEELNAVLGASGRAVVADSRTRGVNAGHREMSRLVERMRSGQVGLLVTAGANPAYALPSAMGFADAMAGVARKFALASHLDETAALADWILPANHALESWTDAEVGSGHMALGQPVMRPVFDTRQREDVLLDAARQLGLALSAEVMAADDYAGVLRSAWTAGLGGDDQWREALKTGGAAADSLDAAAMPDFAADTGGANGTGGEAPAEAREGTPISPDRTAQAADAGELNLVVYPTPQFYDGRGANRSWMQEQPDAITKVVWGSWVELHPETAAGLGIGRGDMVRLTSAAGQIEAPAYPYRGIRRDTVAVPMGQGHTAYGRNAEARGVNALDLLAGETDPESGALAYAGTAVTVERTGNRGRLIVTQGALDDLDREIAHAVNIDEAMHAAELAAESHEVDLTQVVEAAWDSDPNSPYRWGMVIDLNSCTGCGACVTSCYAENNIPVVGEDQAALRREMSWLRIHRFEEETADGGFTTVHQPMACQHCGDAPCEPVCPVYATYHNPEGLNVQVYNRCVGTRYCANNCPYKVRRFNWFTYDFDYPLNLQLNPDITVREVGVMEKCTMCVHRINRAKIDAKEEGRTVEDGEIQTACQSSCPTQAITFGNLKDPDSAVSRAARNVRGYHALGELGVRPAVTYLEAVTHAEMPASGHADHAGRAEH